MGWFNKKEEVPQIAPAPTLPELPKKEVEAPKNDLPELPSFPSNSANENLNQEIVKSAVTDNLSPVENEVNTGVSPGVPVAVELPGGSIPPVPSVASTIPAAPAPTAPAPTAPAPTVPTPPAIVPPASQRMALELNATKEDKPITKPIEPIYIRIDKFQAAQKNFENVKDKITEIESLLQKVRDVKSKEETELNGWAEDIEKIKARLAEVDSDIFNQL